MVQNSPIIEWSADAIGIADCYRYQILAYFTFGKAYFCHAFLYFQIRRILVRRFWRTLKKAYLGVITTKYNFNTLVRQNMTPLSYS